MPRVRARWVHILTLTVVVVMSLAASLNWGEDPPIAEANCVLCIPAYASGFTAVAKGEKKTFAHNLGGSVDSYVVIMDCKDDKGQLRIGPFSKDATSNVHYVVEAVTATSVTVARGTSDDQCDSGIRVRIWNNVGPPSYDSGFADVPLDGFSDRIHVLGGNADRYFTILDCKSSGGVLVPGPQNWGSNEGTRSFFLGPAGLGADVVQVTRTDQDVLCGGGVRVRIWSSFAPPNFDSGFRPLQAETTLTINHGLSSNIENSIAILDCKGEAGQVHLGPLSLLLPGGHGQRFSIDESGITATSVSIRRSQPDSACLGGARIRIWETPDAAINPAETATASPTVTRTVTPTTTPTATTTSTATATPTATTTASASPTSTSPPSTQPARWLDRPPAAAGAASGCPGAGLWLLTYWGGSENVAIASAVAACATADLYWVSREGKWMGFSKNVPVAANDSWNVLSGEAHFVHGGQ